MRARHILGAALGSLASLLGACTGSEFATAPTDEDTGGALDGTLDSSGSDSSVDGLADTTSSDVPPPKDGGGGETRPDTATPTCTSAEKFVRTEYPVGTAPSAITAGDIDGNATLDLVVANGGSGTINVLTGRGDGTFVIQAAQPVAANPNGVVLGDFDNDKNVDVAATASTTTANVVGVLLGNGTAKLGAVKTFTVGVQPNALAAGKLNADGRTDLVVTAAGEAAVYVLLSKNESGSLGFDSTKVGVGLLPTDVVITDLTKDGFLDFVVVNGGADTISLVSGSAGGTYTMTTPITTGLKSPRKAVMADFGGKGRLDLAVTNNAGPSVAIFPALGTGSFGAATQFPAPFADPTGIGYADLDGDGHIDVVAGGHDTLGLFDVGSLSPTTAKISVPAVALVTGDFNGDAKPDIATVNTGGGSVTILLACR